MSFQAKVKESWKKKKKKKKKKGKKKFLKFWQSVKYNKHNKYGQNKSEGPLESTYKYTNQNIGIIQIKLQKW